jgi:hypothetical protein
MPELKNPRPQLDKPGGPSLLNLTPASELPPDVVAVIRDVRRVLRETDVLFSLLSDSLQFLVAQSYGKDADDLLSSDNRMHAAEWIASMLFDAEQSLACILRDTPAAKAA